MGQNNFLFRRRKELESSDWAQGAKRIGVLISLQLRVSQPGSSVLRHDLMSVGDIGEHFIGEERKADRPAGAAVGTQVEPRASTSPSPTLPTYLMESISCRRVDEATKEPYSHLADPRPMLISGKRESMMEPEYQGLIPQLCCLLCESLLFLGTQFPHLDKPVQLMAQSLEHD